MARCWVIGGETRIDTARPSIAAEDGDSDFHEGKRSATRYFFVWELPKVDAQLDLLASLDRTTLDMQDAFF